MRVRSALLLTMGVASLAMSVPAATYEAPLDVRQVAQAEFNGRPRAVRRGEQVEISFGVSNPTDVEVAILDSKGQVVRHLAAGLLGDSAPAPLQKGALQQELLWDLRDDQGKAASGGPFKIRLLGRICGSISWRG